MIIPAHQTIPNVLQRYPTIETKKLTSRQASPGGVLTSEARKG
jgi:hypothetical protein